ncbi:MAG: hypothetical protein GY909_16215 [Oligoflexia bacterium]|nr:hypothetical protein [Oligoflexia bacterium]
MKDKITSKRICALLDEKYHNQEKGMIAFEVGNSTGLESTRRADAISFEFWPSNGFLLTGYEIKVSRGDWLNELKAPEKSHAFSRYCNRWYLVAPKGVLMPDELPKGWGYIQASEKALRKKIKAPSREVEPIDIGFMASVLRAFIKKYDNPSFLEEKTQKIREEINRDLERNYKSEISSLSRDVASNRLIIDKFNKETGLYLATHNVGKVTELFNLLRSNRDIENLKSRLSANLSTCERLMNLTNRALEELSLLDLEKKKDL